MSKEEILKYFIHINVAYNDCGRYDSLKYMLEELEQEIRNKVIDEFVDKSWDLLGAEDSDIYARECIKEIAEQMKGGAE